MYIVRNKSNKNVGIPGVREFEPGEERDVNENTKSRLLRNPNFELVENVAKKQRKYYRREVKTNLYRNNEYHD